jgi:hypothetical protein
VTSEPGFCYAIPKENKINDAIVNLGLAEDKLII